MITIRNTKTNRHRSMMLTVSASAEVQGLNAAAMQEILSSGTIASGMLLGTTTRSRSGRLFYTTSEKWS